MGKLRVLTLCSGIGAPELAARWVNEALGEAVYEIAGQVEIDPFACAVLEKNFPGVLLLHDVREVRGDEFGSVNVMVAGFPCQPVSHAGKRRGASDDRWLWDDVCRILRAARPDWAIFENVSGLISLGLDTVLRDLDAAGYAAWPFVFPAAAIGAPHNRERIFVVAYAGCARQPPGRISGRHAALGEMGDDRLTDGYADVAHSNNRQRLEPLEALRARGYATEPSGVGLADASSERERGKDDEANAIARGREARPLPRRRSERGNASNRQAQSRMGRAVNGLSRWLDGLRWPAPRGCQQEEWERPRTTPKSERIEHRADRLKALGNAIVPQQIFPILWTIAAMRLEDGEEDSEVA